MFVQLNFDIASPIDDVAWILLELRSSPDLPLFSSALTRYPDGSDPIVSPLARHPDGFDPDTSSFARPRSYYWLLCSLSRRAQTDYEPLRPTTRQAQVGYGLSLGTAPFGPPTLVRLVS